ASSTGSSCSFPNEERATRTVSFVVAPLLSSPLSPPPQAATSDRATPATATVCRRFRHRRRAGAGSVPGDGDGVLARPFQKVVMITLPQPKRPLACRVDPDLILHQIHTRCNHPRGPDRP